MNTYSKYDSGSAYTWGMKPEKQAAFLSLGFGTHIAYNIECSQGTYTTASAGYDPDNFNPSALDVGQWLDATVAAGGKYSILSVKTHTGFCLYPSQCHVEGYAPYSIVESAWYDANNNRDIVQEFIDGCIERDLKPVLYFSIWDYTWEARTGTDQTTNATGYIAWIKEQMDELLVMYPNIYAIWFDGWRWHIPYTTVPFRPIYDYIKSINPNVIIISNDHLAVNSESDVIIYETPVDGSIPADNLLCAEEIDVFRKDHHWWETPADNKEESQYYSAVEIKAKIDNANTKVGNYVLTIMPYYTTGLLTQVQLDILDDLGALM